LAIFIRKPLFYTCSLLIATAGFGLIALGRLDLSETWEVVNTVIGTVLVSAAHFVNWKLLRLKVKHEN